MKYFLKKIRALYFRFRATKPVWLHIINRRPRRAWQTDLHDIEAEQKRIIGDLKKNGIAVSTLQDLFPGTNMLRSLQEIFEFRKSETSKKKVETSKKYLEYMYEPTPTVEAGNPIYTLALSKPILNIVNGYLNQYSFFYYMTLNITRPVDPRVEKEVKSQRWHRDPEDRRLCKIFVYLSDVDRGAGPFMYVSQSNDGGRFWSKFPQIPQLGCYPPLGAVEKVIPKENIKKYEGGAGTVIFCDTAGIHKGGYATARERVMLTLGYRTWASSMEPRLVYPNDIRAFVRENNLSQDSEWALTYRATPFSTKMRNIFKDSTMM